jgi:CHAT domain-containing protein
MMLMARFYEGWRGEGLEPPEALRRAQLWLRETTNGERARYYKRFLPEFDRLSAGLPVYVADALYKASVLARPDENDFAHPFYWAAFTYTGA